MATVFFTPARDRYFLVPDGVTLPPGPLEVRSPAGVVRHVEEEGARRFEMPENVAHEHLREHRAVVGVLARGLAEIAAEVLAPRPDEAPAVDPRGPFDRLLASIGASLDALHRDPHGTVSAMSERLRSLARAALREAQARARPSAAPPTDGTAEPARPDRPPRRDP